MLKDSTISLNESFPSTGSTPRPKGERGRRHAGKTGEASRRTLAKAPKKGASMISGEGSSKEIVGSKEIVRATTKFLLEPWLLASPEHKRQPRACGGKAGGCQVCALLTDFRTTQWRAARGINAALRELWRIDADVVDSYLKKHGCPPKGVEFPLPKVNTYKLIRDVVPELASGISASLSQKAQKRWAKDRYKVLIRDEQSIPHFNATMPVPIRRQDVTLREMAGKYTISFALEAASVVKGSGRYIVPIRARDAFQKTSLRNLSSGAWRLGEVSLKSDRRDPTKWYATLAYKRLIESVPVSERIAAINRGVLCIVAMVTYDGRDWIDDGNDVEEYLRRCNAYRRQFQRAEAFAQRKGHGRRRLLKPTERIRGKANRYRETRLQTTARNLAKACSEHKVSIVFIEDFTGIRNGRPEHLHGGKMVWDRIQTWPYYELQTRFVSCLEEYGISAVVMPPMEFSRSCPECGHVHEEKKVLKGRAFKCDQCGYMRHYDVMQAQNLMRAGFERLRDAGNDVATLLEKMDAEKSAKSGARKGYEKGAKTLKNKGAPRQSKKR